MIRVAPQRNTFSPKWHTDFLRMMPVSPASKEAQTYRWFQPRFGFSHTILAANTALSAPYFMGTV
jgi:hypothetical protein